MTRSLVFGGLAAACLTLAAGAGAAQTPERPVRAVQSDPLSRTVSRADFVDRRLAPLIAMDADRDGTVSVAERRAARETRIQALAERRFDRLDADGNGVISREEFAAAGDRVRSARRGGDRLQAPRGAGAVHRRRAAPERVVAGREAKPVVIADVRSRIEAAFDRLDADRDGTVTAAERQAARTALRERGASRRAMMRMHRRHVAPSPSVPASE